MGEPHIKTSVHVRADLWRQFKSQTSLQGKTITARLNTILEREVGPDA